MWRPWRKSCGNESDVRGYVPCEQCESSLSMNTYTTLTPSSAISMDKTTLLHRNPLIQEQSEALTIKSDCASLSDDEVTGSDTYRPRYYYDSPISESPPPLVYYPLDRPYNLVNSDLTSQAIPTLNVASPEVINFIKQRDLDLLVDRIENYNCNDSTMNSFVAPRTMVDNETTEPFIPTEDDVPNKQSSISCCDGLTLLSALAEQRALEEESRLEYDRCYSSYPYTVDYKPTNLLTPPSSLSTGLRKLNVNPPDRMQSVERPISTSSTDCNFKEDSWSDEPTFEPQSNSPIPTTSPPPPPSSNDLPPVITPSSNDDIKKSSSSSPSSTSSSSPLTPSETKTDQTNNVKASKKSPTSNIELPFKKRNRESSSSSNEYSYKRRSERLFVLESCLLYGIKLPDSRRELFENTPSKSKKSAAKSSSSKKGTSSSTQSSSTPSSTPSSFTNNNNLNTSTSNSSSANESCQSVEAVSKSNNKCDLKSEDKDNNTSKVKRKRNLLDNTNVENDSSIKPVTNVVHKSKKSKSKSTTTTENYKKPKNKSNIEKNSDSNSAFTIESKEWNWSGPVIKKATGKCKAKKTYYKEIVRGKEIIKLGECAVFYSKSKPTLPYVGRIDSMWQTSNGSMIVRLKWFYHPEETKSQPNLKDLKGALFESRHYDQNDVRTILHKCSVLPWEEYQLHLKEHPDLLNTKSPPKFYYLAGYYDPITGKVQLSPGIPLKDA